ncbi:immune-associated nucleotide-binding protein 9-like [Dendrobium catenatum]|uniref:immune-associated nucleotide-binding protein 9-like n=1 Tax=Dendrobium catenatum TaxID=906689 RepID=UPI00109F784D|nr:immune-associated nucleotide-binding protein 9-like [Dendrobium catenatum]
MIKREEQLNELLLLVEFIIVDNGGKSYSKKTFAEHKERALLQHQNVKEVEAKEGSSKDELSEHIKGKRAYDDQQKGVTEIVKEMVEFCTCGFWEQLAKEQAAQLEAEERAARLEEERIGQESLKDKEI